MRLRYKLMFAVQCAPYLVCVYTGLPGSHTPTASCNEVDSSGLLFGVPHLKGIVIFRAGLLKKHPCAREVARSNVTARRCILLGAA